MRKNNSSEKVLRCPHGCILTTDQDTEGVDLMDNSLCDCCGDIMHHNSIGFGYYTMLDGRTLCSTCVTTENTEDIDS